MTCLRTVRDANIIERHRERIARIRQGIREHGMFPKLDPMTDPVHHVTLVELYERYGDDEDLLDEIVG